MDTIEARTARRGGAVDDVAHETEPLPRVAPVTRPGGSRVAPRTRRQGRVLPRPAEQHVLLVIQDEPDVVVLPLAEGHTRIGRSFNADVELDDASVSRRHAVMVRDGDTVQILDDRSRNGVLVNGTRVLEMELHNGDVIRLGRVELRFVSDV